MNMKINNNLIKNKKRKKLTKMDLRSVFFRSNFIQGSWNFERMQALGFCFSIIPAIKSLYQNNLKEQKIALKRHLEFFNTHPYFSSAILGIVMAMEEEKSNGSEITSSSISNIKVGLMGPLAGIGDPIFWGIFRPLIAILSASIAISGNFLGPILFFFIYNSVRLFLRYFGMIYGYKKGIKIIQEMSGNLLKKITEGASIVGLFIMGSLINKWTNINISLAVSEEKNIFSGETTIITVQNILDKIVPGMVPLLLTFFCMWVLSKKINSLWIIGSLFLISIIGAWIGFLT